MFLKHLTGNLCVALAITAAVPMLAKRNPPPPTVCSPCVLPLAAKDWELSTWVSPVATLPLKDTSTGALEFTFPQASSGDWAAYLTFYTAQPLDISANHWLSTSVQVNTTGSPVFGYMGEPDVCGTPANTRPMIWGAGTTALPDGRWWSDSAAFTLAPGSATLTVSLDPAGWSNWMGQYASEDADTLAAFQAALKQTQFLALTFSGGCSYGHGVNVSGGTAVFKLLSYSFF